MGADAANARVQRRSGRDQRWCIPSAILRSPGESLDGTPILHEIAGEPGLLLWCIARDVTLWAGTPASKRRGLFGLCSTVRLPSAAAGAPAELRPSLENLSALLARPAQADAELLALGCLEVTAWARRNKAPSTALAFAQAGALAAPEMAEPALQTAICAREAREPARAETWVRRAIAVARRERDRGVSAAGYVLLGNLHRDAGNPARAGRYLAMGLKMARRAGVPLAGRDAAYGLFRLAVARGDTPTAARMAQIAQRHCTGDHAGSAAVLLDLARFWTDQAQPIRVRNALRRLTLHVAELTHAGALAAAALMTRMLAETGHPRSSRAAAARTWGLLVNDATPDDAAYRAVLDLAHAAAVRRDRDGFGRAERAALRLAPLQQYEWTRRALARMVPEEQRTCAAVDQSPSGNAPRCVR